MKFISSKQASNFKSVLSDAIGASRECFHASSCNRARELSVSVAEIRLRILPRVAEFTRAAAQSRSGGVEPDDAPITNTPSR